MWETAAMAFDSSAQSYWQAGGVAPQWLRLVADNAGEEICGYQMTVRREHCCAAAHSPARWQLLSARLGARDDWSVLHEGSQASWDAGETREFQLGSPASVDQVQLNILATVADDAVCAPGANGTEARQGAARGPPWVAGYRVRGSAFTHRGGGTCAWDDFSESRAARLAGCAQTKRQRGNGTQAAREVCACVVVGAETGRATHGLL